VASHVLLPVHSGLSSALVTARQAPVAQERQAAVQAALQQTPSLQKPVAHSVPAVHACPVFFLHAPAALHVLVPVHSGSSSSETTAVQVPVAHW
jgi:hypothetical protein